MDSQEMKVLEMVIDNQLNISKKLDVLIKTLSDLTNTIIKYDNDYQNSIIERNE